MTDNILNDAVKAIVSEHIKKTTVFDRKGKIKREGNNNQVGSTKKIIEDILPDIFTALEFDIVVDALKHRERLAAMTYGISTSSTAVNNFIIMVEQMKLYIRNPLTGELVKK